MKLKEKMLRWEINKYINDNLFDIEIDIENGIINCYLKNDIKKNNLRIAIDNYNQKYTVLNLISLNDIKRLLPDNSFKKINYVLSYNNVLGNNVVIKSNDDVILCGTWDSIERLKVESQNLFIQNNSKIVPNASLNIAVKKSIYIDSSIVAVKSMGVGYICCDEQLNIKSSDLIFHGDNLVVYSSSTNIYDTDIRAKNMYLINKDLTVDESQMSIQNLLDINTNQLNLYTSDIFSNEMYLSFKKSDSKDNSINAQSFIINGSSNESTNNNSLYQLENNSAYELLSKTKVKSLNN